MRCEKVDWPKAAAAMQTKPKRIRVRRVVFMREKEVAVEEGPVTAGFGLRTRRHTMGRRAAAGRRGAWPR